jgi:hypothetical protein
MFFYYIKLNSCSFPEHICKRVKNTFYYYYYFLWLCSPAWAMASSFMRFLDYTQWHATVSRTPLNQWQLIAETSTWQLTTHTTNIHAPSGIWTHDCSRWAAVDLRLRTRDHWDWQEHILQKIIIHFKPYFAYFHGNKINLFCSLQNSLTEFCCNFYRSYTILSKEIMKSRQKLKKLSYLGMQIFVMQ